MLRNLCRLLGDRDGATGIEYAMAVSIVAVILVTVGSPLRAPLADLWSQLLGVLALL